MINYNSTIEDVKNEFNVEDGIIKDLGMFEGEAPLAPILWQQVMNGFEDDLTFYDGGEVYIINIREDLAEQCNLEEGLTFVLRQDINGFVLVEEMDK